ncbi:hybrid sensor histidine kinase/response regulator [Spirochaeta dissipatitropha]
MADERNTAVIMIVDDTPANLEVLEEILSASGYIIKAFPSGERALASMEKKLPDVILLDVMMPGMDGYTVCRKIKEQQYTIHIPVLFISALGDTESKIKGFSAGGVDYVTKPFQEAEVLARVNAQLTIASLQKELQEHNSRLEELVSQRTRELSIANERLRELGRLKDEFMSMISHEIRTPANGLLGMGELIIAESDLSESGKLYRDMFRQSGNRLLQLIEDSQLIMEDNIRSGTVDYGYSLSESIQYIKESDPHIHIQCIEIPERDEVLILADRSLLQKSLSIILSLAACFSEHRTLTISCQESGKLNLEIQLEPFSLQSGHAAEFFNLESSVRGASYAQELGLAPVVARKILNAFGGELGIRKDSGNSGVIFADIPMA